MARPISPPVPSPAPSTATVPWHWRSRPLGDRTGAAIFFALFRDEAIATLLESPYPTHQFCAAAAALSRYSICAGSPRSHRGRAQLWTPTLGEILPFLTGLLDGQPAIAADLEDLPFRGGWLGWLGYDLAWEIERLPVRNPDPLPFPVAYWYEPDRFAVLDHGQQRLWLAATDPKDLDEMDRQLARSPDPDRLDAPELAPSVQNAANPSLIAYGRDREDYCAAVRQAQEHIRAGDIFQANLTLRFSSPLAASGWDTYRRLRAINPSPFGSYWRSPWGEVVSCSPERLLHLGPDETGRPAIASTRPIAGTRPRSADETRDRALADELRADPKERAEHTMLVDLERNDLGRVCDWGSVVVDEFFTVERYSHVMHLVSNVTGRLRRDRGPIDALRAVFPGGTITGCPKVRCMEIIERLEPVRRNLFYGSCGYLDLAGRLDLNILIRTLLLPRRPTPDVPAIAWGQVGAGIVADSDPDREWHESLSKAAAQIAALSPRQT
ncbi:MAG: anthranilate synthase component I [Cyanobacteria bacterium]|nr:anthranilate synthase component I [Cyanobacteriota bacterium]